MDSYSKERARWETRRWFSACFNGTSVILAEVLPTDSRAVRSLKGMVEIQNVDVIAMDVVVNEVPVSKGHGSRVVPSLFRHFPHSSPYSGQDRLVHRLCKHRLGNLVDGCQKPLLSSRSYITELGSACIYLKFSFGLCSCKQTQTILCSSEHFALSHLVQHIDLFHILSPSPELL